MEGLWPTIPDATACEKKDFGGGLTFALQALLTRHETYVGDSQREHERLTEYINELEEERVNLQTKNEKIVEENRELLTQLEAANTSLKESDEHVKDLDGLLRDCELEVRRLNFLTHRTEELELQLLDMERDRTALSHKVDDSNEETKSTIMRWKESELKVRQLENEVQKIEWEARQDKERHEEVIARLERESVLERELGGAEGRLKGAAALQGLKGHASGSNVVSHFVRDILQDNANLQAGIAELRELLETSNDEVQNLREQVILHQPIGDDLLDSAGAIPRPLSEQLNWSSTKQVQQEVHVHHHYHAKIAGKKDRTPTVRRSSRRRAVMGIGVLPSPPDSSAPSTPTAGPHRFVSSPILPITLHQPQARRNRWSVQSAATGTSQLSSFPGSPRSYYDRSSAIFDRLETGEDSSRPTSPESAAGFSESMFHRINYKTAIEDDSGALEVETVVNDVPDEIDLPTPEPAIEGLDLIEEELDTPDNLSRDLTPKPSQALFNSAPNSNIVQAKPPEPPDRLAEIISPQTDSDREITPHLQLLGSPEPPHAAESDETSNAYDFRTVLEVAAQPRLRRKGSHDSLVSISGMDIHIAKRPTIGTVQSSNLFKGNRGYFTRPPSATRTYTSAQPLATVTEFTALSSMRSFSADNRLPVHATSGATATPTKATSLSIEALSGLAGLSSPVQPESPSASGGISRLVGGWVRSKWGIAPVKSSGDLRAQAQTQPPIPIEPLPFFAGRSPGINQPGSIPGFRSTRNAPTTEVMVNMVDEQGLRELLAE